jgi:hypothetical protein
MMVEKFIVAPVNGAWCVSTHSIVLQITPAMSDALRDAVQAAHELASHGLKAEVVVQRGAEPAYSVWCSERDAYSGSPINRATRYA